MVLIFSCKKIFEENLVEERKESAKKIEEVLQEEQERAKVVYVNKMNTSTGRILKVGTQ